MVNYTPLSSTNYFYCIIPRITALSKLEQSNSISPAAPSYIRVTRDEANVFFFSSISLSHIIIFLFVPPKNCHFIKKKKIVSQQKMVLWTRVSVCDTKKKKHFFRSNGHFFFLFNKCTVVIIDIFQLAIIGFNCVKALTVCVADNWFDSCDKPQIKQLNKIKFNKKKKEILIEIKNNVKVVIN